MVVHWERAEPIRIGIQWKSEADRVIEVDFDMDGPGVSEGILYEMRERDVEYAVLQRPGVKSSESCSLIVAR